jgi:chemotaxis protein MotB
MAKKAPSGAPSWIVTFADLMSLLVCFFVLIISFSVPDIEKLKIAAGSIRDAFGFTREIRVTGVVELEGNPMYEFAQDVQPIVPEETIGPIPDPGSDETLFSERPDEAARQNVAPPLTEDQEFALIQEQLQQALEASPLLAGLTDNLHIEMTPEGLKIELIDQARMSMFPLGSARMHEPTRALLREIAAAVGGLPNRIEISGHTDSYRSGAATVTTTGRSRSTAPTRPEESS